MIGNSKRKTCYPPYILQRSCHHNPEPWTLNPLPFLKTLHEKTLDTAASNWYNNTRLSQELVKRSPKERRKTSWQTKANVILSHKSHDRAANTDRSKAQMKTRPWKKIPKKHLTKRNECGKIIKSLEERWFFENWTVQRTNQADVRGSNTEQ